MASDSVGTPFPAREWYGALFRRQELRSDSSPGSFETGCSHRSSLHPFEGEAGYTIPTIRTSHMQAALPSSVESFRVRILSRLSSLMRHSLTSIATLIPGREYGSARSASSEILSRLITRTSPSNRFHPSYILQIPRLSTDWRGPPQLLRSFVLW
jgi:hypothetical protein